MPEDLLTSLNPDQRAAVTYTGGPLLVLAGAGSGKTKVLTHRAAWLITEGKTDGKNILLLTFTNKAAKEMKERIAKIIPTQSIFAGTFHSFCVRVLRQDGESIGVDKNFLIYDEQDKKDAVKDIMTELNYSTDSFNPNSIAAAISDAKNQMITPLQYSEFAKSNFGEVVFKVYLRYEKYLTEVNGLDFDDLLIKTVTLFQKNPTILTRWQNSLAHIFVDEWQDTNKIQYALTKLLVGQRQNLTVVGDAAQCLPPGTMISTSTGEKRIENISKRDRVLSATGRGSTGYFQVKNIHKRASNEKLLTIKTKTGKILNITPNHILFSKLIPKSNLYHVYLMYKKSKGYRIGIAKGERSGYVMKNKKPIMGISSRGNQESADKMWVLETCQNRAEATYYEFYYAFKYGIPTLVFNTCGRSMKTTQDQIDRLFLEINTDERAHRLMEDLKINPDFPHHRPKGTSGNRSDDRQIIHLKFFEDPRKSISHPWCAHRISLNTTDRNLEKTVKDGGFYTRPGRRNTWRTEIMRLNYEDAEECAKKLAKVGNNIEISNEAFLVKDREKFYFQPASHLRVGMVIPICLKNSVVEEEIVEISKKSYKGYVYDLDVENVHNYSANGIIVHNSIYSWRGADYRNITYLLRDFPKLKTINLEQNYRSTQTILEAANAVISKNTKHPVLKLWTNNQKGQRVKLFRARSGLDEAGFVVDEILTLEKQKYQFQDVAVLYRTNAQSRVLEEALLHTGIPYVLVGGVRFYDRKEVKDVLAYIRILVNPKDKVSQKRVEKIGMRRREKFLELQASFIDITSYTTLEIMDAILAKTEYLKLFEKESEENISRLENIKELRSVAAEFPVIPEFLENVALVETEQDSTGRVNLSSANREGKVTLMTLHAAKGLEFPVVFIVGMEEGLFPHSRSLFDMDQLEEERRLAYVGMTRAKKLLYLTFAGNRLYFGQKTANPPSRFIIDIPEHLLESEDGVYRNIKKNNSEDILW